MDASDDTPPALPAEPGSGSTRSLSSLLLRSALLALACGLLQAWLPGYLLAGSVELSPLSLLLGLAAAAAMARGPTTLPAALAGLAAGAWVGGDPPAAMLAQTVVVGLQAALAGTLMRRADDPALLALDTRPRLERLVLVAAPAAAALGAVLQPLSDAMAGGNWPALRALATVLLGRALVDWAGIVTVAAIVLCWLGWPAAPWRPRRRMLALPLGLLLLVMLPGFHEVARRDEARLAARFQSSAADRLWRAQSVLAQPMDTLVALRGLLLAADGAGRTLPEPLFDRLVDDWTRRLPGLIGAGWADRGADGAPVPGHARRGGGGDAPALPTPLVRGWARVLDADHAVTLGDARDTTATSAAAANEAPEPVLVLAQVLPATADHAQRVVYLRLRTDLLLQSALPAADDANLAGCLIDRGEPARRAAAGASPAASVPTADDGTRGDAEVRRLAGPAGCEAGALGRLARTSTYPVALGDRPLRLVIAEPAQADDRLLSAVWLLALPAITGTALLATLLLALSGRIARIEDRVRERTAALRAEIEERRRAEARLAQSEQRFRAIFDSVHIGVTMVDPGGRIVAVNPAFCTMMGASADALLHRPLDDFRLPDVTEDDGTAAALAGTSGRRQRYMTVDGRLLQVAASLRTLHDADGQLLGTVGALADLSPMLHLREAERERDEAAIASRTKSEFLSRLSHELRAPLNAIMGFAQMIGTHGDEADPAARRHGLEQIRLAGWHLLDMINDVLDLSRMEAGNLRLTLEPVSLPEVAQEALAIVEPLALKAGVALELSLSPLAEHVQADPVRLRQVLINLLSNAVRYNRPNGRVELRARPYGVGDVAIEVHDTGIGLSEEQLSDLFTPFNRLGREARERVGAGGDAGGGTGIGLVICRRLVDLMSGEIEVASTVGQGSVFTVRLPKAQGRPQRVEVSAGATMPSTVAIGQLLYIEDRVSDVAVMRQLLTARPGVTLVTAATAAEGLAAAGDADLVLLDLDLPDRPGVALLRELREHTHTRTTPVIVVSGDSSPARIDECFEAGATDYLTKPLDAAQLLRAVDDALK